MPLSTEELLRKAHLERSDDKLLMELARRLEELLEQIGNK